MKMFTFWKKNHWCLFLIKLSILWLWLGVLKRATIKPLFEPILHDLAIIGSASLARSIRIRFHFRHRTGRIRSVSDHRAGRVWRSRHRSKTPNCLPGARDQVPVLFRNAVEQRGASVVDPNSGAPITQSTFDMLRRMANPLSLLNWWLHRYDNEDDYFKCNRMENDNKLK